MHKLVNISICCRIPTVKHKVYVISNYSITGTHTPNQPDPSLELSPFTAFDFIGSGQSPMLAVMDKIMNHKRSIKG
jgi:hypothetical protein